MELKEIIKGFLSYYRHLQLQRTVTQLQGLDARTLFEEVCAQARPCFILSTGRCGTKMLSCLLEKEKHLIVEHQPDPEMLWLSKYAYQHYQNRSAELKTAFIAARYEMIRNAFLNSCQYVETNNRITFFAYQIQQLFPKAVFIHLLRNPFDFVRSGKARGWYLGKHLHDEGRITPSDQTPWKDFNQVQKIAWLWNATNSFIETFKEQSGASVLTLKFEDLFSGVDRLQEMMRFMQLKPLPAHQIRKRIAKPVNASRRISELTASAKESVEALTPLSKKYYP